jgi:hypothetical protein
VARQMKQKPVFISTSLVWLLRSWIEFVSYASGSADEAKTCFYFNDVGIVKFTQLTQLMLSQLMQLT